MKSFLFLAIFLHFLSQAHCHEACWKTLSQGCPRALDVAHTTTKLSAARRNTGAAALGSHAVFVGGCDNTGTSPSTQFVCDSPSSVVDVMNSDGTLNYTTNLSEKRGWVATCALGSSVVMAGGGVKGTEPHSRVGDVLDVATGKISSDVAALSSGRWGVSCATVGSYVFFAGGKVTINGYKDCYMTEAIDQYSPFRGWSRAPFNLSVPRESSTAAEVGGSLLVAGGWTKSPKGTNYHGVATVDIFNGPASGGAVSRASDELQSVAYDVGAVTVGNLVYVVGNVYLSTFNANVFVSRQLLPENMRGPQSNITSGGAIPSSHIPQNGAKVTSASGTVLACFYGKEADSGGHFMPYVYCYDVNAQKWVSRLQCSAHHQGGSIVGMGKSVWVAGGFDPTSGTSLATAVVDIFTFN